MNRRAFLIATTLLETDDLDWEPEEDDPDVRGMAHSAADEDFKSVLERHGFVHDGEAYRKQIPIQTKPIRNGKPQTKICVMVQSRAQLYGPKEPPNRYGGEEEDTWIKKVLARDGQIWQISFGLEPYTHYQREVSGIHGRGPLGFRMDQALTSLEDAIAKADAEPASEPAPTRLSRWANDSVFEPREAAPAERETARQALIGYDFESRINRYWGKHQLRSPRASRKRP